MIQTTITRRNGEDFLSKLSGILWVFVILQAALVIFLICDTHIKIEEGEMELKQIDEYIEEASKAIVIPVVEKIQDHKIFIKKEVEATQNAVEQSTVDEVSEETTEPETIKEVDQSDVELLAQLMYAEESVFLWQYDKNPERVERVFKLAGSVVLNRLENNFKGANSIHDVIYSKGQYAKRTQNLVTNGQDVPEIVYVWAQELLNNGSIAPKGMIYQSEFLQGQSYDQIGNQFFGIEPRFN